MPRLETSPVARLTRSTSPVLDDGFLDSWPRRLRPRARSSPIRRRCGIA